MITFVLPNVSFKISLTIELSVVAVGARGGITGGGATARTSLISFAILISMSFDVKMVVKHQTKNDNFIYQYHGHIPKKRIRQHVKEYVVSHFKKTEPNIELKTDHKYLFLSQDESKENINPQEFLKQIMKLKN